MKIDPERVNKRLRAKQRKGKRVTLYLTETVYEDFRRHCKGLAASAVINDLMQEYMAAVPGPMQTKYKKTRDV